MNVLNFRSENKIELTERWAYFFVIHLLLSFFPSFFFCGTTNKWMYNWSGRTFRKDQN
jgi:hypothetical protein